MKIERIEKIANAMKDTEGKISANKLIERLNSISFWELLTEFKVEIPIIQRDFALGREEEKIDNNRAKFLTNIIEAVKTKNGSLELDFVYGNVEDDIFQPLDGQQRLTTLFLLHWYIAFKTDNLPKTKVHFCKFTYETRISSREFCEELARNGEFLREGKTISEKISDSNWFFLSWKKDPTIKAMLVMLDSIEEHLKEEKDEDLKNYWQKLTSENPPITFYFKQLNDIGLTDDLYIKMNARGKALTSFENLKADLVGFIEENNWDNAEKPQDTIAHKLDTDWTDIFWKNRSEEHKIDDIYFAFINRYFLNCLITAKKSNEEEYLYPGDRLDQCSSNKEVPGEDSKKSKKYEEYKKEGKEYEELKTGYNTFSTLYGSSSDDSKITYSDYDIYKPKNGEEYIFQKVFFERLTRILDNFYDSFYLKSKMYTKDEINKLLFRSSLDSEKNFPFISEFIPNPKAKNNNNEPKYILSTLTQAQRVVFYAICCFFENNKYDDDKTKTAFEQWMRVVWNIVENANITGIPSMVSAMRLVDELKPHAHDIYSYLANSSTVIISNAAPEQVKEEIEKAKQILKYSNNIWKDKIKEAEKTAFFKGAIRFLFRTGVNSYDWNKFDDRFEKAKQYFDEKGVTETYASNAILLRALISKFSEYNHFEKIPFDKNADSWKVILLRKELIYVLNDFFEIDIKDLNDNILSTFSSSISNSDSLKSFHEDIVRNPFLARIDPDCIFHEYQYITLHKKGKHSQNWYVFDQDRNQTFYELEKKGIITVVEWQKINDLAFFKGTGIQFKLKCNGKTYIWSDKLEELREGGVKIPAGDVKNLKDLREYLDPSVKANQKSVPETTV